MTLLARAEEVACPVPRLQQIPQTTGNEEMLPTVLDGRNEDLSGSGLAHAWGRPPVGAEGRHWSNSAEGLKASGSSAPRCGSFKTFLGSLVYFVQRFAAGGHFAPIRGLLTISGDMFGCHNSEVEARHASNCPAVHREVPHGK